MVQIKAREIREKLQGKIHPIQVDIMCQLAEQCKEQRDQIHMLAHAYDRLVDQVVLLMQAAGAIADSQANIKMKLGLGGSDNKGMGVDVSSIEVPDDEGGSTH